jgi:putative aldouronate transport system permease protein
LRPAIDKKKSRQLAINLYKHRYYYLLLIPVIAGFILFNYIPMYGVTLAFKDYNMRLGILASPWAGFKYFDRLFASKIFWEVTRNTIIISVLKIIFNFPAPIMLALMLNEIPALRFKKFVQTVSYFPHFISWVVLSGIIIELLSPARGVINYLITLFGGETVYFLAEPSKFRGIIIISDMWKTVGWGTIIYLAAMAGVDMEQYEAAFIDGASRFQIIKSITLPSILPVISIVFILNLGGILNAGFDQIFNLYNPTVYKTGDIIDTYVYRVGFINMDYSFSTAVNLFKNLIGLFLVVSSNAFIRRFNDGENALW